MHRAGTSPFPPGSPAPKTTTTHSLLSSSLTGHAWCLPRASPQRIDSSPCLPPTTGNASASPARVTSSSPGSRSWAGPCRRARACRSSPGSCSTPATASSPPSSPRPTWRSPSGRRSTRRSRREGAPCCRAGCCSTSCAACPRDPCRSHSRRAAGSRRSSAGASEYKLHTYGADDYPELPEIDRERLFTVEREAFLEAIERVVHAASRDEARPVLTGVHVELGLGTLTVAATDSYRLAVTHRDARRRPGRGHPGDRAGPRARRAGQDRAGLDGDAASRSSPSGTRCCSASTTSGCPPGVIEGQFPNFRALRPDAFEHEVVLPRTELAEVLVAHGAARPPHVAAAAALRAGRAHGVGPDAGGRRGPRDGCPATSAASRSRSGSTPRSCATASWQSMSDEVHLKLISSLRPGLLTAGGDDFWYLVMPIRLSG